MTRKFCTLGWALAAVAVLFVGAQFFDAGALSSLPFGKAPQIELMAGAGPAGPQPQLW
jgi:hypothetical protein